jgi:hypothetical protein
MKVPIQSPEVRMADVQIKPDRVKELVEELRSVRSCFETILEKYSLNMKARFDELVQRLDQEKAPEERLKLPKKKDIVKMVEMCRKLKLKPEKGRAKDIKKVQTLLKSFDSILPK